PVPAVAQQGVVDAGGGEQVLGGLVFAGEQQRAGRGVEDGGVGDEGHAGRLGGVDDVGVLGQALPDLASGDEQQLVDAGQGLAQGGGVAVVGDADLHAVGGEVGGLGGVPDDGDDVGGSDPAGAQGGDGQAAEVAGGSGDGDGHGTPRIGWDRT